MDPSDNPAMLEFREDKQDRFRENCDLKPMKATSAKNEKRINVHVTYGQNKKTIETTCAQFLSDVRCEFGISDGYILIKRYIDWNGLINISHHDIDNGYKLIIEVVSRPCVISPQSLMPSVHTGATNMKVNNTFISPTEEQNIFAYFSLPQFSGTLKNKLNGKKSLGKKDKQVIVHELGQKIKMLTYSPTTKNLRFVIKMFLNKYSYLAENHKNMIQKKNWVKGLREWFVEFGIKSAAMERKSHLLEDKILSKERDNIQCQEQIKRRETGKSEYDKATQTVLKPVYEDMSAVIEKLKTEWRNPGRDMVLIDNWMRITFQSRRNFIVCEMPRILTVKERFPALFSSSQVMKDFWRITIGSPDNSKTELFNQNLRQYSSIIFEMVGADKSVKKVILNALDTQDKFDNGYISLLLLPSLLGEDLSFLCMDDETFNKEQVTPWIDCGGNLLQVTNGKGIYKLYIENVLICEPQNLIEATECFLACFFTFNIQYPYKHLKMLQILQNFFMNIEDVEDNDEPLNPDVVNLMGILKSSLSERMDET